MKPGEWACFMVAECPPQSEPPDLDNILHSHSLGDPLENQGILWQDVIKIAKRQRGSNSTTFRGSKWYSENTTGSLLANPPDYG
ncbi:hypothetical protein F9C07_10398 [Aspergillus flavus]|uniref:Uncharacterized protein n=1 Tax=Aspergillus flavus (strain ATCC 200026 / FGSC A1120 / IAM 13836 / NRRL 3357 / JCM 12722 / SRRC 167) TaxID=332952 RepID=A0A7U2QZV9_ASPFN|nr:hypothetical protein F9C07_10398 [Aspergillus flavus]